MKGMLKAVAALLAPLALPLAHSIGLTELTAGGIELALIGAFNMALVYFIPNKTD